MSRAWSTRVTLSVDVEGTPFDFVGVPISGSDECCVCDVDDIIGRIKRENAELAETEEDVALPSDDVLAELVREAAIRAGNNVPIYGR